MPIYWHQMAAKDVKRLLAADAAERERRAATGDRWPAGLRLWLASITLLGLVAFTWWVRG